ncbi:Basic blue protein [Hordeum vulgare]|nr:Basic blue protein [Hordeum vulgare]
MALGRSVSCTGAVALVLVITLCCANCGFSKTEWIVGGHKGWTFGVHGWENNKTFYPGDVLVFKYNPKMHNVVVVNKDESFFCRAGAVGDDIYTSGYDKLELSNQGPKMYAISSKFGDCEHGMRIEVPITTKRIH